MDEDGEIVETSEGDSPRVPMDYTWAKWLDMVRKPTSFVFLTADDHGEGLMHCGVANSEVFVQSIGIGGALSLQWFRRQLPPPDDQVHGGNLVGRGLGGLPLAHQLFEPLEGRQGARRRNVG